MCGVELLDALEPVLDVLGQLLDALGVAHARQAHRIFAVFRKLLFELSSQFKDLFDVFARLVNVVAKHRQLAAAPVGHTVFVMLRRGPTMELLYRADDAEVTAAPDVPTP